MSNKEVVLVCCALLVGLGLSFNANACSVSNWDVKVGITDADSGSPPPVGTTSRMERFCGLEVTSTSYVQDNSPVDGEDTRIRLRFYVLISESGSSEVILLQAFDDDSATTEAFSISYKSASDMLSFSAPGVASSDFSAPTGWVEIQVDWEVGVGFRYWVNTDPNEADDNETGNVAGAGTTTHVGMVRLGAPVAIGDVTKLTYDSYQANRTTSVPTLLDCDADASGLVALSDILTVIDEVFGDPQDLSTGQPDCDRNGIISISDILLTISTVFPPA